ncbi:MAG: hypothetical protein U0U67_09925 [Chitinophagales bacterium]
MEEQEYEIPIEGSLGLLALGHIGLQLWREKRAQSYQETKDNTVSNETSNNTNPLNLYFEKTSE